MIEKLTPSQERTKEIVLKGENVVLTGEPGTGKTELVTEIKAEFSRRGKKVLIAGATGMAASNYDDGRTIHSITRWNPAGRNYDYDRCCEEMAGADVLIVDEVSMMGASILDHVYNCYVYLGSKVQMVFVGDFFQLPPVKEIMYPFENLIWHKFGFQPCVLKEVVRQKDPEYKENLALARVGDSRCIDYFNKNTYKKIIDGAICLCTKNKYADEYNEKMFNILPGKSKVYTALDDSGAADFNKSRVKKELVLKKNMRVMALRNDPQGRYQNGSLGTVMDMSDDCVSVMFDNGNRFDIARVTYTIDNKVVGGEAVKVEQFPLIAGSAITIHKSQGQTFDSVNIMAPNCWEAGQLYVALSRSRTVGGMHLMVPIDAGSLKTDPRVVKYYNEMCQYDAA